MILGLERPQQGQVLFQGHDIYTADKLTRQKIRRDLQVVFQDSYSAVNPRMTAESIIGEPLENYEKLTVAEQKRTVIELLERVGLSEKDLKNTHTNLAVDNCKELILLEQSLLSHC